MKHKQKGFTLTELLVVLFAVAVIALAAVAFVGHAAYRYLSH